MHNIKALDLLVKEKKILQGSAIYFYAKLGHARAWPHVIAGA